VADSEPEVTLDGQIERFVFKSEDPTSSFIVARFVTTANEPVTILGDIIGVEEGWPLRLKGKWVTDKKWGKQFRVATYARSSPSTLLGITRFLGSGSVAGIGPKLAEQLVAHFKYETLDIIDRQPERLVEVPGIGTARAKTLAQAFAAHRDVQDVMVFLHGHGVSSAYAARIYKRYGKDTIKIVRENPYRLAHEVWGIGFRKADAIAEQLGLARDAPARLEAGLLHALETSSEDGHLHLPDEDLFATALELLATATITKELLEPRLAALEAGGLVVRELLGARGPCSALPTLHDAEVSCAERLAALVRTPPRGMALDVHAAIGAFQSVTGVQLATQQYRAVEVALLDKCVVITGGPGVGKTTIIKAIVHLSRLGHRKVALSAPTGRAAKRLAEATEWEATTIHRLLEYQPHLMGFSRDRENPLEADVVIVDEASMLDILLFRSLLDAMKPGTQLVLVGDIDQLPSVGAGAVLGDVIASGTAVVIRLTEIFRQAAASKIVVSAHRINNGEVPDLDSTPDGGATDFYFIGREDPLAARDTIVELVAERIPKRFGFETKDIQVLAPMHRGELGTTSLNNAIQTRVNPQLEGQPELVRGDRVYRRGDKVMQLKNDYDKSVYNGDIGTIHMIDPTGHVRVEFDGRMVVYQKTELDQLVHAYAVSIHKSQGSEYAAVVIPLVTQHFVMLQRSLLYTAVTRGKKLVVLVGAKRAVAMAVKNVDAKRRYTWLSERLRALTPSN